jgi:glycosyltransferase involved in cell wall biosynthesis
MPNSPGLVSVIIPAYNAEKYLARTLVSALRQDYASLEVLVVDDGSSDRTAEIAAGFALSDKRVQLHRKTNGGVASARNLGIDKATGTWLAFLDADDLWHPTKISKQVSTIRDRGLLDGGAGVFCFSHSIDQWDRVVFFPQPKPDLRVYSLPSHIAVHPVGNGSSLMLRKEVALEVGGFDESYLGIDAGGCEDLDFELSVVARYPICALPEFLVGYRTYPGNMSSNRERMCRAMAEVTRRHTRNKRLSVRVRRWAWSNYSKFAIANYTRAGAYLRAAGELLKLSVRDAPFLLARSLPSAIRKVRSRVGPYHRLASGEGVGVMFELADVTPALLSMPKFDADRIRYLQDQDRTWRYRESKP